MKANKCFELARSFVKRSGTRNPVKLAKELGVEVWFRDLGRMKGLYTCIEGQRFIVVNDGLDGNQQNWVCAHELGHDQLHRELATDKWLREFELYKMNAQPEYEANCFAAELLLSDRELLDYAERGYTLEQLSAALYCDANLVAIKISCLADRGYNLNVQDFDAYFLR